MNKPTTLDYQHIMRELPSATSEDKAEKFRQACRALPPPSTSQLKCFGIDLPFTITKIENKALSLSLGMGLSIVVIAPSNERETRQILLVHHNRRRRVVHATNLKPCILLVWIALLIFCFG